MVAETKELGTSTAVEKSGATVQVQFKEEYNGIMKDNNRLAAHLLLAHLTETGAAILAGDLKNLEEFVTSDSVRRRSTFRVNFTHHTMTGELYYTPDAGYACPKVEPETGDMVEVLTPKVESTIQYTKFTSETAQHLAELVTILDMAMKALQPAMEPQKVVIRTAQEIAAGEAKRAAEAATKAITKKAMAAAEGVRKHMKVGSTRSIARDLLTGVPAGTMNLEFHDYGGKVTRRYSLTVAGTGVLTRLPD